MPEHATNHGSPRLDEMHHHHCHCGITPFYQAAHSSIDVVAHQRQITLSRLESDDVLLRETSGLSQGSTILPASLNHRAPSLKWHGRMVRRDLFFVYNTKRYPGIGTYGLPKYCKSANEVGLPVFPYKRVRNIYVYRHHGSANQIFWCLALISSSTVCA